MDIAAIERFWAQQEHISKLIAGYSALVEAGRHSHDWFALQLRATLAREQLSQVYSVDRRTLQRFFINPSKHLVSAEKRTALLLTCEMVMADEVAGANLAREILELKDLCRTFHVAVPTSDVLSAPRIVKSQNPKLDAAVQFIAGQLFLEPKQLLTVAKEPLNNWLR